MLAQITPTSGWFQWVVWFLSTGVLAAVIAHWLNMKQVKMADKKRCLEEIFKHPTGIRNVEFFRMVRACELYFSDSKRVMKLFDELRGYKFEAGDGRGGFVVDPAYNRLVSKTIDEMCKVVGYRHAKKRN